MLKFVIDEIIDLKVDAISFEDGEKAKVRITLYTLLDGKKKELKTKDYEAEISNSKASYQFKTSDLCKELSVDVEKVKYIHAWMDADGEVDIDYDSELEIEIVKRKGTLRMGIFFDGTGNDPYNQEEYSNVKKLFDLYPNQIDGEGNVNINKESIFPSTMSAYIRGVGSDSKNGEKDGALSSGFALGMTDRMSGMLFYIQSAVEAYKLRKLEKLGVGYFPETLEFDIFGFSRGAATARHFVNILKQEGGFWSIKIDGKEVKYSIDNTKIITLNIFDTVGSSGIPGRNIDPGFTYHIDPSYIERKVHHFVANDEYRSNFDGQLSTNNNTDYPRNINDRKFEERVLFGAHSDIGGGYPNSIYHQVTNNELSKYYLDLMYKKCLYEDVPLGNKPTKDLDWKIDKKLEDLFTYFDDSYLNYPSLKIAHKKIREWQSNQEDKFISYFDKDSFSFKVERNIANRYKRQANFYGRILGNGNIDFKDPVKVEDISYAKDILDIFAGDKNKFIDFIKKSNEFHDKYVHISHGSGDIGMSPQDDGSILHRDYFIPQKENMQNLNDETINILSTPSYSPYGGNAGVALSRMNKSFAKLKAEKFEDY